eukprot:CAMPEP_0115882196 /NCGR_PEP_ID=MMETSP0287-20121206/28865_1 /TAXON_ID=412157 /ORGANISM="Chrysochromulina rotalis, Strain UIO044" /LENGTH=69 /DNA_ID=CAMNT_0003338237 /DNA_START=125 /DNA_END=334 /DNA_ORIENTATION=+
MKVGTDRLLFKLQCICRSRRSLKEHTDCNQVLRRARDVTRCMLLRFVWLCPQLFKRDMWQRLELGAHEA